MLLHRARGFDLAPLRVLREPTRIALDHDGVGREGEAEGPRRHLLSGGGRAARRREVVDRRRTRVGEAGQRDRGGDGRGNPRQRNDVAQPYNDRCVRTRDPVTSPHGHPVTVPARG